ncbi:MAG: hypothetical protein PHN42_05085 [Bacilli bacterium]|nr:hypothetical protein [Bacilli bacterium]
MNINYNKVFYLILGSIAIALLCVLTSLLLLTNYITLQYLSVGCTFLFSIYFINTKNKYSLLKK